MHIENKNTAANEEFSKLLRAVRSKREQSISEVAAATKLSVEAVTRLETYPMGMPMSVLSPLLHYYGPATFAEAIRLMLKVREQRKETDGPRL